jgi:hypothetical protein
MAWGKDKVTGTTDKSADDRQAGEPATKKGTKAGTTIPTPSPGSHVNPWIPHDDRLFDRDSIIVMLVGCLLFVIGLGIKLSVPKFPELASIVDACVPPARGLCEKTVRAFDRQSHSASEANWAIFLAETLQALGLTMLAAVFISSTVDRRTRGYFFDELARKTEALGSNVLLGMFETRHHPRLFSLVKEHIFEKKIIRRNIDINYTLTDLDIDLSNTRLAAEKYLAVDVIISTVSENINVAQTGTKGIVELPIRLGLPNPILPELKPFVKVNSFRIGDVTLPADRIAEINEDLQKQLVDDRLVDAPVNIGSVPMMPGEQVTVSGSYTMVKELQDTEVFRSNEIAENIHLTVVSKSRDDLVIQARSLAHGKLYGQVSPTAQQWKLDDLSLPLQGIMVWWKKSPKALSPLQSAPGEPRKSVTPQENDGTGDEPPPVQDVSNA